jgi:nitrile hydratase beta subunit
MNGVHDMGGLHGMGPIQDEHNEPIFHSGWEGRVFGLNRALGAWRKWSLDASRHQRELIPPADFFRMSYYEKWFTGLTELLVRTGLVTRAEIVSGKPARGTIKAVPALQAAATVAMIAKGSPARRDVAVTPLFRQGQRVRARNINPIGHTRLPRYARGKSGTVERDYGVFVFPDTSAHSLGEKPQHVYSVRFAARELWGQQAEPQDAVYLDLWDDYLESA